MRVYYRDTQGKRHSTTLRLRHISVAYPPSAVMHFGSVHDRVYHDIPYRFLTPHSQRLLPLPERVKELIAEQSAVYEVR